MSTPSRARFQAVGFDFPAAPSRRANISPDTVLLRHPVGMPATYGPIIAIGLRERAGFAIGGGFRRFSRHGVNQR
jgi:hypothetical protein